MKNIFSNVMLVAAAAMTFFGCQKPEMISPEYQTVNALVFGSEKPSFNDETKTEWTGETIQWSKGDKIRVAYTCDGVWQNADGTATDDEASGSKTAKIYESAGISEAGPIANFSVPGNFKGDASGVYEFYGVYPSKALASADFKNAPSVAFNIPTGQKPAEKSFDTSSDLMVAKSDAYVGMPTDKLISLKWNRLVAHANLTLKALPIKEDEGLLSIKLTANEGADMVGSYDLYLDSFNDSFNVEKISTNTSSNVLVLDASNLSFDSDGNLEFWACFLPCTWTSITVDVETDKATYTRSVDKLSLEFKQNARNVLAVNMSSAIRTEKSTTHTATLTFDSTDKRTSYDSNVQVWTENGIVLTNNKSKSTSNVGDYYKPARFYKSSTITVEAPGNIYSIDFACNTTTYATDLGNSISGSIVSEKNVTVSMDGTVQSVTYTMGAQVRMDAITVTYAATSSNPETPEEPEDPEKPVDPTPEPEEPEQPEEPAGPQVVTVAEFLAAAVGDKEYQLTGVMSGTYNTTYGNFYLEDETGKVLVYGLTKTKVSENDKSFASIGLRDGDTLTLIGTRADYNGTAQVGGPAYYIGHVAAPYIDLDNAVATVDAEATTYAITVTSNCAWTATASTGVTLDKSSATGNATINMTFAANKTEDAVTYTVTFTSGSLTQTFTLTQNGVVTGDTVEPVKATLSFADKAQRTTFTTSQQIWEQNGIKVINNKASSTNAVADYAKPARFYAGSNLEVTAPGAISMIVFDANSSSYATAMKNSIGTVSGATVAVSSDKVTVTFSTPVASFTVAKFTAQVRMDSMTVTYIPAN